MRRFAYRLALNLGWVDVDAMLATIDWNQFVEWMAFAELEPFDEERADARAAQVATAIYNVNRDKKKKPTPFSLKDVMLRFGDSAERKAKSGAELKALAKLCAMPFLKKKKGRDQ